MWKQLGSLEIEGDRPLTFLMIFLRMDGIGVSRKKKRAYDQYVGYQCLHFCDKKQESLRYGYRLSKNLRRRRTKPARSRLHPPQKRGRGRFFGTLGPVVKCSFRTQLENWLIRKVAEIRRNDESQQFFL